MLREQLLTLIIDVERLMTAGAESVAGHVRLAHHAAALRQVVAAVPALETILTALDDAMRTGDSSSVPALFHLLVRLRTIRGTLASAGDIDGELADIPESGPWETPLTVNSLVAEIARIRTSKSHRERIAKGAERCPADLRIVGALINTLDDSNNWLADSVADDVLPSLGSVIASELKCKACDTSKLGDLRRLIVLCKTDLRAARSLINQMEPDLLRIDGTSISDYK